MSKKIVSCDHVLTLKGSSSSSSAIAMLFSGEETYGKYLDLYTNHTTYNNLKKIDKRLGYLQYLDVLMLAESGPVHRELSKETRLTKDYES